MLIAPPKRWTKVTAPQLPSWTARRGRARPRREAKIAWTKMWRTVEILGSKENNAILLPDDQIETVSLIKEESDPNPERRYKMAYNGQNGKTWVIRTATSADGLHWKRVPNYPIDQFIETSSFYRYNGLYVTSGQRIVRNRGCTFTCTMRKVKASSGSSLRSRWPRTTD